jgi:hypothetical protein
MSMSIDVISRIVTASIGSAGIAGLFWGIYQYRQGQKLTRQNLLFDLIREHEKSKSTILAKKILDGFTLEREKIGGNNQEIDYYSKGNLGSILRDHHEKKWRIQAK